MNLELKYAHAQIKAVDAATGQFEAIVSVFGNVDMGGDRVMPGAFTRTLGEWAAKGDPIPVIWSHEWDDPTSHVGYVVDAKETADGLWVKAQLDVEANPKAAYVARLLKQRRVTQFSFGYFAKSFQYVNEGGDVIRELTDIDLFEVGPTLLGMNPDTQLLQAASRFARDAKAGRVLSAKNEEALGQARDLIDQVLAQLAAEEPKSEDAEGKSVDTAEPDTDTPADEDPAPANPVEDAPTADAENAEPSDEDGSRDNPTNIAIDSELAFLLTRPRYTEENQ